MKSTNKCVKDWNATIEALGHGLQTILIRNYKTRINEFLLYPTVSYSLKKDYLNNFKDTAHIFVSKNTFPEKKDGKVIIKYLAKLEKIVENPLSKIPSDEYYIWTRDHVKDYIKGKTAFIWVLRVYKLNKPYWTEQSGGIRYVNLKEDISLEGIEPVLSDLEFNKVLEEIK